LVVIGLSFGILSGNNNFSEIILNSSYDTWDMILSVGPLVVLWCGIMNIAENSGLLLKASKLLTPLLKKLMPTIKNEKAFLYISSNIAANMLGLGSVATPAGLKAMKELDKENKERQKKLNNFTEFGFYGILTTKEKQHLRKFKVYGDKAVRDAIKALEVASALPKGGTKNESK
jgi:spore maturation protein A